VVVGCRETADSICVFITANAICVPCVNSGANLNPEVGFCPIERGEGCTFRAPVVYAVPDSSVRLGFAACTFWETNRILFPLGEVKAAKPTNKFIMRHFRIFVLAAAVGSSLTVFSQDPLFLRPQLAGLELNPAFAGSRPGTELNLCQFNQWVNLGSGGYQTSFLALNHRVDSTSLGLGLAVVDDNAAQTLRTTSAKLMFSYGLPLGESREIRGGISAGLFRKSLNWSNLTFGDMIDPRRGFIYETQETFQVDGVQFVSLSAGATFTSRWLTLGASAWHINEPNESLVVGTSRLPMRTQAHAAVDFHLFKRDEGASMLAVSPNVVLSRQGEFQNLRLGVNLKALDRVYLGVMAMDPASEFTTYGGSAGVRFGRTAIHYSYGSFENAFDIPIKSHQMNVVLSLGNGAKQDGKDSEETTD